MSIADGQVVLQRDIDGAVSMDFANSISRMGARAPPASHAGSVPSHTPAPCSGVR